MKRIFPAAPRGKEARAMAALVIQMFGAYGGRRFRTRRTWFFRRLRFPRAARREAEGARPPSLARRRS